MLIKPSYFLVLLMAYPVAWIWFNGLSILTKKTFWFYMIPLVLGLIILAIQHHFLYNNIRSVYYVASRTEGAVSINPFHVWQGFSSNIPVSLLLSLTFPIYIFAIWYKELRQSKLLQYLLISMFFAFGIYILISETSEHEFCGNYGWQLYITNYLLFTLCGAFLLEKAKLEKWQSLGRKEKIAFILYLLHILSGFGYFAKMFITRNFT